MKINLFVNPEELNNYLNGKTNKFTAYLEGKESLGQIIVSEKELKKDFKIEHSNKYMTLERKTKLYNLDDLKSKHFSDMYKRKDEYKQKGWDSYNNLPDLTFEGAKMVIESWFYRSLFSKSEGLHPDFETFAAMILNGKEAERQFEKCYNELVKEYGKLPGIKDGASYYK